MHEPMSTSIPLFPLSAVLLPNETINLTIFELRYKQLLRDRLGEDPLFGVILIRHGSEVGPTPEIHAVGTAATLESIVQHEDGRYSLTLGGTERFRVLSTSDQLPYLVGSIEWLNDESPANATLLGLSDSLRDEFIDYVTALSLEPGDHVGHVQLRELVVDALSADPETRSFQIAAHIPVDARKKQEILEIGGTEERLGRLMQVIRRERQLLRVAGPTFPTDYRFSPPFSPN